MKIYMSALFRCAVLAIAAGFNGCSTPEDSNPASATDALAAGRLRIGCTTNIVKDMVVQIGGDHVVVTAIMDGPGIDPHLYTPSPQDINALTESDVVVYSGLHLEAQLEEALESLEHRRIPVIKVTEVLEKSHPDKLLRADGTVDPHVWFDPQLWAICGDWLAEELGRVDATHADDYKRAAGEFQQLMVATQTQGEELLSSLPTERRILVTAHDAFQYFARAFQFQVEAVQGLSTESEPGLKRINELATLLVDKKINAIFTEQSVSDRNISALIAECSSRGHSLEVGGRLYSDTAGPAGTPEESMSGAILHDIREIAAGLSISVLTEDKP